MHLCASTKSAQVCSLNTACRHWLGCLVFQIDKAFFSRNEDFTVQSWLVLLFGPDSYCYGSGPATRQVEWNAGCSLLLKFHPESVRTHIFENPHAHGKQDKCCRWWSRLRCVFCSSSNQCIACMHACIYTFKGSSIEIFNCRLQMKTIVGLVFVVAWDAFCFFFRQKI